MLVRGWDRGTADPPESYVVDPDVDRSGWGPPVAYGGSRRRMLRLHPHPTPPAKPRQPHHAALTQNVLDAYQRGANGVTTLASGVETQAKAMSDQVKAGFDTYQSKYCTPATFMPGSKVPANFTGPAMSVTFSTGSCTFNETRFIVDGVKELACQEPSIVYTKTAPTFTSKHISPASFQSKECKVSKAFGTPEVKTLLTFDGSQHLDTQKLTAQVRTRVRA